MTKRKKRGAKGGDGGSGTPWVAPVKRWGKTGGSKLEEILVPAGAAPVSRGEWWKERGSGGGHPQGVPLQREVLPRPWEPMLPGPTTLRDMDGGGQPQGLPLRGGGGPPVVQPIQDDRFRGGGGPSLDQQGPGLQAVAEARRVIGESWVGVGAPAEERRLPGAWQQYRDGVAGARPVGAGPMEDEPPVSMSPWAGPDVGEAGPWVRGARELGQQAAGDLAGALPLLGAAWHDVKQMPVVGPRARRLEALGQTALTGLNVLTQVPEELLARTIGQQQPGGRGLMPLAPGRYLTNEDRYIAGQIVESWQSPEMLAARGIGPARDGGAEEPDGVLDWVAQQGILAAERKETPSVREVALEQYGPGDQTEMALARLGLMGYSSYEAQVRGLHRLMAGEDVQSVIGGRGIDTRQPGEEDVRAFQAYVAGVRAAEGDNAADAAEQEVLETGRIPGASDLANELLFQIGLDPLNVLDIGEWAKGFERAREAAAARFAARADEVRYADDVAKGIGAAMGGHPQGAPLQELWKRVNPFELTPGARAERLAGTAYQVAAPLVMQADSADEAAALIRALAEDPERLVAGLGNLPVSGAAAETRPVFEALLEGMEEAARPAGALGQWDRLEFMAKLDDTMMEAARTLEGVSKAADKGGYQRFADGFRHTMSEFYLRTPGYAAKNATGDVITMAWDGVLSLDGRGQIDDFLGRIGATTRRMGGSAGGQQAQLGRMGESVFGGVLEPLGKASGRFGRWISQQEEARYTRAFYKSLTQTLGDVWRPRVPVELAARLDPGLVRDVEAGLRRGMNADEFAAVIGKVDRGEPLVDVGRYVSDPDALSVGLRLQVETDLEAALLQRGAGVETAIDEVMDGAAERVRESTARAFASDPTPPGRRVFSDIEAVQDLAEEQATIEGMARAMGVPEEVAAQRSQELADLLKPGEQAIRRSEEELLTAVRVAAGDDVARMGDSADVMKAAMADTLRDKMVSRVKSDELRVWTRAQVRAAADDPGISTSAVWEKYWRDVQELHQQTQAARLERLGEAAEQLQRVRAGEAFEDVMGRPAGDVIEASLADLRSVMQEIGARQSKMQLLNLEEFGDFDKMLDARRLVVDVAQMETWRMVGMNPTRDTLDVVTSTQIAVDRLARAAAAEAENARELWLAGAKGWNRERYHEVASTVWDGFFSQGGQAWDLARAEVAALPMSAQAQRRAVQALGWPDQEIDGLTSGQLSSVLHAGVKWDPMLEAPSMPLEEAIKGSLSYVAEQAGLDVARAADWTPADWQGISLRAQELAKAAGERASTAARLQAAAIEEGVQQAARRPQTVHAGMELVYPASVDDVARAMGMRPQQMGPEDWQRVAEAAKTRGDQLRTLGDDVGRILMAETEAARKLERGMVGGQERMVRRGRMSARQEAARARELGGQSREATAEVSGWMLEQAGYEIDEIQKLNGQQRAALLSEIVQGDVGRTSAGRPVRIGAIDPQRRHEVMHAMPEELRRQLQLVAVDPEKATAYRWLEIAEEARLRSQAGGSSRAAEAAAANVQAGSAGGMAGANVQAAGGAQPEQAGYVVGPPGRYDARGFPVMRQPGDVAERVGVHAMVQRAEGMVPDAEKRGLGRASVGFEQYQTWLAGKYTDMADMAKARGQLLKGGARTGRGALEVPAGIVGAETRKDGPLYILDLVDDEQRVLRSYTFDAYGEAKAARKAAREIIADGRQGQAALVGTDYGAWRIEDVLKADARTAAAGGYAEPPTLAEVAAVMEGEQLAALEEVRAGVLSEYGGHPQGVPLQRGAVDPVAARQLKRWSRGDLAKQWTEARSVAVDAARQLADEALLDYTGGRRRLDDWLNLVFPYTYWKTRSARNWAMRFVRRPGALASYVRMARGMKRQNEERGYRARFEGYQEIPAGGVLPDWMGDGLLVNPAKVLMPWTGILGAGFSDDPVEAENAVDLAFRVAGKLGMRPYGFIEWPAQYFGWVGDAEDIGYLLPHTGALQAGTAALREAGVGQGVIPPGGVNIERGLRRGVGLPEAEPWSGYRVGRMASNTAALNPELTDVALLAQELQRRVETGELSQNEAMGWRPAAGAGAGNLERLAQVEGWTPDQVRAAQAYLAESVQRAALERGVSTGSSFVTGVPLRVYPSGERRQVELSGEERAQQYSPLTGTGSREQLKAWQAKHPETLTRKAARSTIDASEFEGWAPGEMLQSREDSAARDGINVEFDRRRDELLAARPWDREGLEVVEAERREALDGVSGGQLQAGQPQGIAPTEAGQPQGIAPTEAGQPQGIAPTEAGEEAYRPRSTWGASPQEAEEIRREEVLAAVSAGMPRWDEFEEGEGYEQARLEYQAGWSSRAAEAAAANVQAGGAGGMAAANVQADELGARLAAIRGAMEEDREDGRGVDPARLDEWLGALTLEDVERYWRRNDTELEALQRVWGDEVYGETWGAYHDAVDGGMDTGDAYERFVEGAQSMPGSALIAEVLREYPDRWTREELERAFEGVEFPSVAEVANLRKPPEERELGEAAEKFWRTLEERLPPGRMTNGAREHQLVQLVLDAETRGTATAEQYRAAVAWLEEWRAANVSEEWWTPADWREARELNEEFKAAAAQRWPRIEETLAEYYELSQAERRAFKAEHPEVGLYFDLRDEWGEEEGHEVWAYFYLGAGQPQGIAPTGPGYGRRSYGGRGGGLPRTAGWGSSGPKFYPTKYPAKFTLERPDPWGGALRFERYYAEGTPWVVRPQWGARG